MPIESLLPNATASHIDAAYEEFGDLDAQADDTRVAIDGSMRILPISRRGASW
jgi:hypothetical protein